MKWLKLYVALMFIKRDLVTVSNDPDQKSKRVVIVYNNQQI